MTVEQKRIVLKRIQEIESDIKELKRVRVELATNGYASASLSSTGGSKSYTILDLDKISKTIVQLQRELEQNNSMAYGSKGLYRQIYTIYD